MRDSASEIPVVALQEHLTNRLPFYLNVFKEMVAINSFTANVEGVNKLGELTAQVFKPLGFSARFFPHPERARGDHLLLTCAPPEASGREPSILFVSHLDTVFPEEEERANNFHWREVGDRIYGPGTCDIKGGTIVALMVCDALRVVAPELWSSVRWGVALDACEETLSDGFVEACKHFIDDTTRAALVFEMGGGDEVGRESVATGRKGRAIFTISVEGKAGHAGNQHDRSANAIVQLSHLIGRVATLTDYTRGITFNVGMVEGGAAINRVPHDAIARGEMRSFDPDVFREGVARLKALEDEVVVRAADGSFACRTTVNVTETSDPWPHNPATERLFEHWQDAACLLGISLQREQRGGLSDANHLWSLVPTLDGLGPLGGNDHCSQTSPDGSKDQEFVLGSSMVPRALLNACGVMKLLRE